MITIWPNAVLSHWVTRVKATKKSRIQITKWKLNLNIIFNYNVVCTGETKRGVEFRNSTSNILNLDTVACTCVGIVAGYRVKLKKKKQDKQNSLI